MSNLPRFKVYPISLVLGETSELSGFSGDYIVCLKASEQFLISINADLQIPLEQGLSYRLPEGVSDKIETLQLSTTSGAAIDPNEIEIGVGSGELRDLRFNSSAPLTLASGSVVKSQVPATLDPIADATLTADTNTLVSAANADRRTAIFKNLSTSVKIRLASVTGELSSTRGVEVEPNQIVELDLSGAIYARAVGSNADYSFSELNFA